MCPLGSSQLACKLRKVDLVICRSSFNFLQHYSYKLRPPEAAKERRCRFSAGIREIKMEVMQEGHLSPHSKRSGLGREGLLNESRQIEVSGSSETFCKFLKSCLGN